MEEQVIQETPVVSPEQPVAEQSDLSAQLEALKAQNFKLIGENRKSREGKEELQQKLNEFLSAQKEAKTEKMAESGEFKSLWEEANKTAQEKDQQIVDLQRQLEELRTSNETAAMKTSALSAISQSGAINADQMLQLVQSNLKKAEDGSVKVLNGGVEEDINVYLAKLKNPGSGFEHHFKPSSQAGMGAKPTTGTAGAAGIANPWLEGSINLTRQMALEATDPDLAAVLKREAGK
nr:phage minor structural protein GP20 [uncultured Mediterranean phage uvMED]BAR23714.1 phage minor structural protein GP20 [uncultured Mediterranean phage uvMED]